MEYFFPSFDSNETSIKPLVVQFDRSLGIFFFLSDRNFLRKLGEKRKHTLRFHARGIRTMNYECVSRVCDPRQLHFCGESNRIPASRNKFDSLPRYLYLDRNRRPLRISWEESEVLHISRIYASNRLESSITSRYLG